jgi:hypothetical protein
MRDLNRTQIEFVRTEFNLAKTFCKLAGQSDDVNFQKNLANARQAYSAAVRYISRLRASKGDLDSLNSTAVEVEALLRQLEPTIRSRRAS